MATELVTLARVWLMLFAPKIWALPPFIANAGEIIGVGQV